MWMMFLVGCASWGPRGALREVDAALAAPDRAALEQRVDLDVVVPEMAAVCARLQPRRDLVERQFRPASALGNEDLATWDLGVASAFADPAHRAEVVEGFRARFPILPTDDCPELAFVAGDADLREVDADHWKVTAGPGWVLDLAREDDGWHVVHANGDALVLSAETDALQEAHRIARDRVDALGEGSDFADWEALRAYAGRHPDDRDVVGPLEDRIRPLVAAPSLLPTAGTGFYMPSTLIPVRHVATEVMVDAPVQEVIVRFDLEDAVGGQASSLGAATAIVVRTGSADAGPLRVSTRAGLMSWGSAVGADATVIQVTRADGTVVRHPAVEAGLWQAVPNSELHGSGN